MTDLHMGLGLLRHFCQPNNNANEEKKRAHQEVSPLNQCTVTPAVVPARQDRSWSQKYPS